MVEFSFMSPGGTVTMQDVMITLAAFLAGWVKFAQKAKDEQIKSRDDTITFLKEQITYLQEQIHPKTKK